MTNLLPISHADQLACAERELAMRKRVYPRWIATGKLTTAKAEREIAVMASIVDLLRGLRDG